jgi:uncharacterized lipoprotein YmbA
VLATDLDKLVVIDRIVEYPWYSNTKMDYAVAVAVTRFEPQPDGDVVLNARWSIRDAQSNPFVNRELRLSRPADSPAAVADAMSQMVGDLALAIANELRELDRTARR